VWGHRQVKEAAIDLRDQYDELAHGSKWSSSGHRWQADHLSPRAAPVRQELSSCNGRGAVAPASEVIAHSTERHQEALGLLRRLEPPHSSFTLTRRLV
jgi:hypothetical protein